MTEKEGGTGEGEEEQPEDKDHERRETVYGIALCRKDWSHLFIWKDRSYW